MTTEAATNFYAKLRSELRQNRQFHGLSQTTMAENLTNKGHEIKQSTVSVYERDPGRLSKHSPDFVTAFLREYKFSDDEAQRLTAELFLATYGGVLRFVLDSSDTLTPPTITQGRRNIPVYSHVGAGPGGEDGVVLRYLEIDESEPGDVAYEVNGHSMEPEIPHGSTVVVKRGSYQLGDIVVAWVPDEGMVVKRLTVSTPEQRAVLSSENPDYAALIADGATIFGRVVETRKQYR